MINFKTDLFLKLMQSQKQNNNESRKLKKKKEEMYLKMLHFKINIEICILHKLNLAISFTLLKF